MRNHIQFSITCALALALLSGGALSAAESSPLDKDKAPAGAKLKAEAKAEKAGAHKAPSMESPGWESWFDGKTLKGWKETDFAGKGEVRVEDGKIVMEMGVMTGVNYTNPVPRMNYEVSLETARLEGSDFFCALTFPVAKDPCTLVVGGWGGGVVGLSTLDGFDASSNETTTYMNFQKGKWYHIRLRVIPGKIQAWIDDDKVVDVDTTGRKIDVRSEVEQSVPFGIATWSTTGAVRKIQVRTL